MLDRVRLERAGLPPAYAGRWRRGIAGGCLTVLCAAASPGVPAQDAGPGRIRGVADWLRAPEMPEAPAVVAVPAAAADESGAGAPGSVPPVAASAAALNAPLNAPFNGVFNAAPAGPVGDASLAELRGGTETPWSDMKLNGTVGNNAATNVVTGANIITDGAFANASGLPMVIQNSGANVLIQNATIVNVQFR